MIERIQTLLKTPIGKYQEQEGDGVLFEYAKSKEPKKHIFNLTIANFFEFLECIKTSNDAGALELLEEKPQTIWELARLVNGVKKHLKEIEDFKNTFSQDSENMDLQGLDFIATIDFIANGDLTKYKKAEKVEYIFFLLKIKLLTITKNAEHKASSEQ